MYWRFFLLSSLLLRFSDVHRHKFGRRRITMNRNSQFQYY